MDTKTKTEAQSVQALADSIGKPSLDTLAYALRHPETWPKGFVWDFSHCEQCAMGLAEGLWKLGIVTNRGWNSQDARTRHHTSHMARAFACPYERARKIFFGSYSRPTIGMAIRRTIEVTVPHKDVTPEMVADRIDAYLAERT